MNFAVENRTVGLVGSSDTADRIAAALSGVGVDVARIPTASFAGRPSRTSGPDALIVVSDELADYSASRRRWKTAPMIAVSDDRAVMARALCLCADDAVASDVAVEELVVRVAVALRRAERTGHQNEPAPKTICGMQFDEDGHALVLDDKRIRLTPRQVRIMSVLRSHVEHNPIPLSRIYQAVCAQDARLPNHETIRVHISMLNKKLASVAGAGVRIRCGQDGYYVQAAA
jgi:DNA-binding response OmpR family regulator